MIKSSSHKDDHRVKSNGRGSLGLLSGSLVSCWPAGCRSIVLFDCCLGCFVCGLLGLLCGLLWVLCGSLCCWWVACWWVAGWWVAGWLIVVWVGVAEWVAWVAV